MTRTYSCLLPTTNYNPYAYAPQWGQPVFQTSSTPSRPIRQNLSFQQQLEVIDFYKQNVGHLTLEQMVPPLRARGFSTICYTTIKRYVNREALIRQYVAEDAPKRLGAKRRTMVCFPQVETALVKWVNGQAEAGQRLSGEIVRNQAKHICRVLNVPEEETIKFTTGWLAGFKKRHGIRFGSVNVGSSPAKATQTQGVRTEIRHAV